MCASACCDVQINRLNCVITKWSEKSETTIKGSNQGIIDKKALLRIEGKRRNLIKWLVKTQGKMMKITKEQIRTMMLLKINYTQIYGKTRITLFLLFFSFFVQKNNVKIKHWQTILLLTSSSSATAASFLFCCFFYLLRTSSSLDDPLLSYTPSLRQT